MRLVLFTRLVRVTACTLVLFTCHCKPIETTKGKKCLAQVTIRDIPGVQRIYRDPSFWAMRSNLNGKRVLMSRNAVHTLNRQTEDRDRGFRNILNDNVTSIDRTKKDLAERAEWLRSKLADGSYIESEDGALELAITTSRAAHTVDQFRIIHTEARLACVPMDASLYKPPIDLEFDRNRCSGLHTGEVVRVLRLWAPNANNESGAWLYVHAGHSVGWLRAEFVTPPMALAAIQHFLHAPSRIVALDDGKYLRLGRSAPLLEEKKDVWVIEWPTSEGLAPTPIPKTESVRLGYPPLTKAAIFRAALTQLDSRTAGVATMDIATVLASSWTSSEALGSDYLDSVGIRRNPVPTRAIYEGCLTRKS